MFIGFFVLILTFICYYRLLIYITVLNALEKKYVAYDSVYTLNIFLFIK